MSAKHKLFWLKLPKTFYIGKSHIAFVGNLADHLAEAGHEVVLYQQICNPLYANFSGSKHARTIVRPQDPDVDGVSAVLYMFFELIVIHFFEDIDPSILDNIWSPNNMGLIERASE